MNLILPYLIERRNMSPYFCALIFTEIIGTFLELTLLAYGAKIMVALSIIIIYYVCSIVVSRVTNLYPNNVNIFIPIIHGFYVFVAFIYQSKYLYGIIAINTSCLLQMCLYFIYKKYVNDGFYLGSREEYLEELDRRAAIEEVNRRQCVSSINFTGHVVNITQNDDVCCICLSENVGECVKLKCSHIYHLECIKVLIKYNTLCSMCRNPIKV